MRNLIILLFLLVIVQANSQSLKDLSFGTNLTLDIMTWNIEAFPKNGTVTIDSVREVLNALDMDVVAFQEISDSALFRQVASGLPQYTLSLEPGWYGGLAYLYKTDTVVITSQYEIYETAPYWNAFPRNPQVMEMTFRNESFVLINNHLKCCGDGNLDVGNSGDEENRRYEAINLLKEYIDTNFVNDRVLVLGDMNDLLTDGTNDNVFQEILDDDDNYQFADWDIAIGNSTNYSYPSWPSHLDHIFITNELNAEFANPGSAVQTLKIDDYLAGGFSEYNSNISDHRPVALKLETNWHSLGVQKPLSPVVYVQVSPNPSASEFNLSIEGLKGQGLLEIYNSRGGLVHSRAVSGSVRSILWNAQNEEAGLYFARVESDGGLTVVRKLMLMH